MLHSPPSDHGFNRTTWKVDDLQQALDTTGLALGKYSIRVIIKKAGYRWLKARKVLTSRDPEYRTKLDDIQRILGNLAAGEGFFSVDEYGPFAVKRREGRRLVAPGDVATVPQWQKSKGVLILTAALELSTNQVTHLYSEKKNTEEMIKLLDILLEQNRHLSRIFLLGMPHRGIYRNGYRNGSRLIMSWPMSRAPRVWNWHRSRRALSS